MKKKLIEVALPLEAINKAAAREKSIRHGHPSTLHLWWARRPLAAARAVIFAQMVDDPSSHPDLFPTQKAQEKERKRLFKIVEDLVQWENTTIEEVLHRMGEMHDAGEIENPGVPFDGVHHPEQRSNGFGVSGRTLELQQRLFRAVQPFVRLSDKCVEQRGHRVCVKHGLSDLLDPGGAVGGIEQQLATALSPALLDGDLVRGLRLGHGHVI